RVGVASPATRARAEQRGWPLADGACRSQRDRTVSESFVDDLLCIEVIGTGIDFSGQDAAVEGADDSDDR
ncbi:hypothetical protein ACFTY8_48480, partial [Streptomyces mirabilis]|uniref:hypothetical protein n=1 Tax=Streptomyces mirabilis TaxID=68239 RepID=UPI003639570E